MNPLAILDILADAIVVGDLDDRIVHLNPAAERLLGWTGDEIEGLPLTVLMPTRMYHAHTEGFSRFVSTGQPRVMGKPIRVPALRRDGREIDIELTLSTFARPDERPCIIATMRDLSERVELERQLRVGRYLTAAADGAARLTAKLDVHHVVGVATAALVDDFDAALARLWLFVPANDTLVLKSSAGITNDTERSSRAVLDRASYPLKVGAVARSLVPFVSNDLSADPEFDQDWLRRERLRSVAVLPLTISGGLRGVVAAFFRDPLPEEVVQSIVTFAALTASAVENARLYAEAEAARVRAEQATSLKDEFVATMSHELRTPLTAIVGWSSMLQEREGERDAAELLRGVRIIDRNARVLVRIVEDVLDVSRIVHGRLRLETAPVRLDEIASEVLESMRPTFEAKGLTVHHSECDGPCVVVVDADRMRQVLWNLLSNATKFTPKGGEVSVSITQSGDSVSIEVRDSGIGIAPSFLPHVFERFRQADGTQTRAVGGLGLGLALVRALVEMHGGTVTASSAGLGQGSTFTVRLPRK